MKTFTTLCLLGIASAIKLKEEDGERGPGPRKEGDDYEGPEGPTREQCEWLLASDMTLESVNAYAAEQLGEDFEGLDQEDVDGAIAFCNEQAAEATEGELAQMSGDGPDGPGGDDDDEDDHSGPSGSGSGDDDEDDHSGPSGSGSDGDDTPSESGPDGDDLAQIKEDGASTGKGPDGPGSDGSDDEDDGPDAEDCEFAAGLFADGLPSEETVAEFLADEWDPDMPLPTEQEIADFAAFCGF